PREVDRGGRLAIADGGAGHGEGRQPGAAVELLDRVAEGAGLLGVRGGGVQQAHEVLVDLSPRPVRPILASRSLGGPYPPHAPPIHRITGRLGGTDGRRRRRGHHGRGQHLPRRRGRGGRGRRRLPFRPACLLPQRAVVLSLLEGLEEFAHRATRSRAPRAMLRTCSKTVPQAPPRVSEPRTRKPAPPTKAAPSPPSTQRSTGRPRCQVKPRARLGRLPSSRYSMACSTMSPSIRRLCSA